MFLGVSCARREAPSAGWASVPYAQKLFCPLSNMPLQKWLCAVWFLCYTFLHGLQGESRLIMIPWNVPFFLYQLHWRNFSFEARAFTGTRPILILFSDVHATRSEHVVRMIRGFAALGLCIKIAYYKRQSHFEILHVSTLATACLSGVFLEVHSYHDSFNELLIASVCCLTTSTWYVT